MAPDDRDQQFERGLARRLREALPDMACADAEVLAAYHEETLSLSEMTQWKQHIASCARCQETLALIEQSSGVLNENAEHEAVEAFDEAIAVTPQIRVARAGRARLRIRPAGWRWLVPAGALAAGLLVWVAVHEEKKQTQPMPASVQVAENRNMDTRGEALERKRNKLAKQETAATGSLESREGAKAKATAPAAPAPNSSSLAQKLPAKTAAPAEEADVLKEPKPQREESFDQLQSSRSAASQAPPVTNEPTNGRAAAAPPSAPQPAPASGAAVGGLAGGRDIERAKKDAQRAESEKPRTQSEAVEVLAQASPAKAPAQNLVALRRIAVTDPRIIVAAGEQRAWRVGDAGSIEMLQKGSDWVKQASGVGVDLRAGSAPSRTVCWVVGKAGTVLLTTDGGAYWKRVTSPLSDDVGGVHAADSLHATIWDVPNRKSFETGDGGATWTQIANE